MSDFYYPNDSIDARKRVERLAWEATLYVSVGGLVLAIAFTWLALRDIPFGDAIASTNAEHATNIILAFYYNCWICGSLFDTRLMKSVYYTTPDKAHFRKQSISAVVLLLAVGAFLLWSRTWEIAFALGLVALVCANIFGWWVVNSTTDPIISASKEHYARQFDHPSIEALDWVTFYMQGTWQKIRFGVMLAFALLLLLMAAHPKAREFAQHGLALLLPSGSSPETANKLVPVAILLVYVLVAEAWIWFMRTVTRSALYAIDTIRSKYFFTLLKRDTPT